MSPMFNNTASQREAAFIKAVKQLFSNSICSNSEHGNTPRCTCQRWPVLQLNFFLALAKITVLHSQVFVMKEETNKPTKKAINIWMHTDTAVIFIQSFLSQELIFRVTPSVQAGLDSCTTEAARCHGSSPAQGGIHFDSCCSYSCRLKVATLQDFWTGKPSCQIKKWAKRVNRDINKNGFYLGCCNAADHFKTALEHHADTCTSEQTNIHASLCCHKRWLNMKNRLF